MRNNAFSLFVALIVLIAITILVALPDGPQAEITNYKIEYAFTNNGCRIYKFNDFYKTNYYADCR